MQFSKLDDIGAFCRDLPKGDSAGPNQRQRVSRC